MPTVGVNLNISAQWHSTGLFYDAVARDNHATFLVRGELVVMMLIYSVLIIAKRISLTLCYKGTPMLAARCITVGKSSLLLRLPYI